MEERSYRLAHYEIILKGSGEIWWKAHGGFADARSGTCFIEGDVLFIGPSEANEHGFLKNEFLKYLKALPEWERTRYYCSSYTLHACKGERVRDGVEGKTRIEASGHNRRGDSSMTPMHTAAFITISGIQHISRVKRKLGEAFHRCKELAGLDSEKDKPEE